MWDQVLQDSNRQVARQTADQAHAQEKEKTRKMEMLLRLALNAGNIDMAMLLFSSLESKRANEIAAGLTQQRIPARTVSPRRCACHRKAGEGIVTGVVVLQGHRAPSSPNR